MQPFPATPRAIHFGLFEVDLAASELRKRGRKVPVQDQPFKVLALLLRSPGELVTREELQRALWPDDTFGDFDEGLNKAIQKLRQALDDSSGKPQFIETLPRKGYRFIATTEMIADVAATPAVQELPRRRSRDVFAWALVAVLSLALVVLRVRERPSEDRVVRFQVSPPEKVFRSSHSLPALSPDGRHLVFRGTDVGGNSRLWIHSLDSLATRALPETEEAHFLFRPFWSPDSRFVGFFQGSKLKKIDISGGPPQVICEAAFSVTGAAWSPDGTILFAPMAGSMRRVSASGGEPAVLFGLDKSRKEIGQMWPHFLPDGRHFLYLSQSTEAANSAIYLASLDSKVTRRLFAAESNVVYARPGFLIYGQRARLMAQPFDAGSLRLNGEAISIADHVEHMDIPGFAFSVSQTGVLAYSTAGSDVTQLAWYNRDGKRLGTVGEPGNYGQFVLSPDEKRLAVEHSANIWILDLSSGTLSRLTFSDDGDPVWSPDGREVLFTSQRENRWGLYRKVVGGSDETLIFDSGDYLFSEDWPTEGKSILIIDQGGKTFSQLSVSGERKPRVLMKSEFDKDEPHVSPDGRWITYNTTESGRWEVYAAAFPGFTEKRQVSNNGGGQALWRKDGKELFYLSLDGKLMAVDVKAGATIETGVPKALFQTPMVVLPREDQYCVTGDGRRFLIGEPVGDAAKPITVVLNWTTGLKR